ncbi:hypothetical protein R1flu_025031 [Riccia fluitans]|uniref:Uncharacterized protein n=1 Tax=Riccia fluitans TaxID=41844 RepID=A0ABD1XWL2_9MARC
MSARTSKAALSGPGAELGYIRLISSSMYPSPVNPLGLMRPPGRPFSLGVRSGHFALIFMLSVLFGDRDTSYQCCHCNFFFSHAMAARLFASIVVCDAAIESGVLTAACVTATCPNTQSTIGPLPVVTGTGS